MKSILLLMSIVFVISVTSDVCPRFQSVIPLNPLATTSNLSLAIVADGKYYLMTTQNVTDSRVDGTGLMPEGFEESRLITVFDRSDCNDSQYYLITIESFRNGDQIQTNYSTLDLKNWSNETEWSLPRSVKELPIIADNHKIHTILEFYPNLSYNQMIHSLFVWDETKTLFVITRSSSDWNSRAVDTLGYYSINMKKSCEDIYSYSKPQNLSKALNWMIPSVDICFITESANDSIIYCLNENSFEANIIDNQFKNGSLRTHIMFNYTEGLPSIDRLYPLSLLCNQTEESATAETIPSDQLDHFNGIIRFVEMPIESNQVIRMGIKDDLTLFRIHKIVDEEYDYEEQPSEPVLTNAPKIDTLVDKQNDNTLWFVLIVVITSILILVIIGVMLSIRLKRNQLARM